MLLDDLYLGNLCPAEDAMKGNEEYHRLNKQVIEIMKQMSQEFTDDQMKLVNRFHDKVLEIQCVETAAKFKYGFALGVLLLSDIQNCFSNT